MDSTDETARPATLQTSVTNTVIMGILAVLLGGLGGAGSGMTIGGNPNAATAADVAELRAEMESIDQKLDDIMRVIDEKHPRK